VLPSRDAARLTAWIQQHPGAEIACRGRPSAYADGIRTAAPEVIQVADRFHLMRNLSTAVERCVAAHKACLRHEDPSASAASEDRRARVCCVPWSSGPVEGHVNRMLKGKCMAEPTSISGRQVLSNLVARLSRHGQTKPMINAQIWAAGRGQYIDEAATIWAETTATRDGKAEIAPLDLARPVIRAVVDNSPRSLLLVALDADDRVVGFAAVEPGSPAESTAELRYLGVRPTSWGRGVGRQLLRALPSHLAAAGFVCGELAVYTDNHRAVKLYEGLGWVPYGEAAPHPRSGRLEQRYRLDFSSTPRS
jgi:ribosomal protein S18 acetylase RimI-like enzyme